MKQPPQHPEFFTLTAYQLCVTLGKMRYDALSEFLAELAHRVNMYAIDDVTNGRPKLAQHLKEASDHLRDASNSIWEAWKVCKPHMKDKNEP